MVANSGRDVPRLRRSDNAKTRLLRPGRQQTIVVRFARAARVAYRCTVGGPRSARHEGHARRRQAEARRLPPPPTTTARRRRRPAWPLTPVGTFDRPDLVTSPPGDPNRLFVVEQRGRDPGDRRRRRSSRRPSSTSPTRCRSRTRQACSVSRSRPTTRESGLFYVFFNRHEGNGNLYLEEFHRSVTDPDQADPYSARVVLEIVKPWENHNGGMLQFGPDGYLYVAVGDGDSGVLNPPGAFAQTLDDLLGNILRIDPRADRRRAVHGSRLEPVRRRRRDAPRDLGVRPAEPVALLGRLEDRRPLPRRRGRGGAGGDRLRARRQGRASTSAGPASRARSRSTRRRRARGRSRRSSTTTTTPTSAPSSAASSLHDPRLPSLDGVLPLLAISAAARFGRCASTAAPWPRTTT